MDSNYVEAAAAAMVCISRLFHAHAWCTFPFGHNNNNISIFVWFDFRPPDCVKTENCQNKQNLSVRRQPVIGPLARYDARRPDRLFQN